MSFSCVDIQFSLFMLFGGVVRYCAVLMFVRSKKFVSNCCRASKVVCGATMMAWLRGHRRLSLPCCLAAYDMEVVFSMVSKAVSRFWLRRVGLVVGHFSKFMDSGRLGSSWR